MRKILTIATLSLVASSSFAMEDNSAQTHTVYLDVYKDRLNSHQLGEKKFDAYADGIVDRGETHNLDAYGTWHVSESATHLKVRVYEGGKESEIELPERVSRGLLDLFQKSPTKTECGKYFDCGCFVHHAHGIDPMVFSKKLGKVRGPFASFSKEHAEYWRSYDFLKAHLVPGDVVYLLANNWKGSHYALYLSPDVYISKFGAGAVYATSLEQMQEVYPFPAIEMWEQPAEKPSCTQRILSDPKTKHAIEACLVLACVLLAYFR